MAQGASFGKNIAHAEAVAKNIGGKVHAIRSGITGEVVAHKVSAEVGGKTVFVAKQMVPASYLRSV